MNIYYNIRTYIIKHTYYIGAPVYWNIYDNNVIMYTVYCTFIAICNVYIYYSVFVITIGIVYSLLLMNYQYYYIDNYNLKCNYYNIRINRIRISTETYVTNKYIPLRINIICILFSLLIILILIIFISWFIIILI